MKWWQRDRSLYDHLNKKFSQLGVFAEHLSIDKSMIPYFGHSGMFIRGKWYALATRHEHFAALTALHFGFNFMGELLIELLSPWVIALSLNFCKCATDRKNILIMFFSSRNLFLELEDARLWATGTVRGNRTNRCLLTAKIWRKMKESWTWDIVEMLSSVDKMTMRLWMWLVIIAR